MSLKKLGGLSIQSVLIVAAPAPSGDSAGFDNRARVTARPAAEIGGQPCDRFWVASSVI